MTAFRTTLGSVSRVDHHNPNTGGFSLVTDKLFKLGERPGMQAPPLSFSAFCVLSDVSQVFKDERSAGFDGLNYFLGEYVIAGTAESGLVAFYLPQLAFGRFGSFLLALAFLIEDFGFSVFPAALAAELFVAGDSWTVDPEINTYGLFEFTDFWCRDIDDNVQPPAGVFHEQVGGAYFAGGHRFKIIWQNKGNIDSSLCCGKFDGACFPICFECVDVVTWRTEFRIRTRDVVTFFRKCKHRCKSFSGLDTGLDVQVADQIRHRIFKQPVG